MLMQASRLPRNVTEFPSEAGITPQTVEQMGKRDKKKEQPEADPDEASSSRVSFWFQNCPS